MSGRRFIFLDFDGVLNTPKTVRRGYDICPLRTRLLSHLTLSTGSRIVFSTSWRESLPQERLQNELRTCGFGRDLPDEALFAGVTPVFEHGCRGDEIGAFLEANQADSYLILDDAEQFWPGQEKHLIRTETRKGLEPKHVDIGRQILESAAGLEMGLSVKLPKGMAVDL